MSRRERRWKAVERRWVERFGEPPFLKTDPDLLRQILDNESPASREGEAGLPVDRPAAGAA